VAEGCAPLGTERDYGNISDFFTRRKEDVSAEWDKIVSQMQAFVRRLSVEIGSYGLHEVTFELGFSAEGHLGFIAKAGANGSVHVTFQRKDGMVAPQVAQATTAASPN
jgi:hypothetical protein